MSFRLSIEPTAEQDIEANLLWLAQHSEADARRWYLRVRDAIDTLENAPLRCPIAPESRHFKEEIRQLLHGKRRYVYRILFTVRKDTVHILHVRHGAQLPLSE